MWWKKMQSLLSMFNCREAVAPRADPILANDERDMLSELRRRHSAGEVDETTNAPALLAEGVVFAPLVNKIVQAGLPNGG